MVTEDVKCQNCIFKNIFMHDLSKWSQFWVNPTKNPNAVLDRIKIQGLENFTFRLLISDKTIEPA